MKRERASSHHALLAVRGQVGPGPRQLRWNHRRRQLQAYRAGWAAFEHALADANPEDPALGYWIVDARGGVVACGDASSSYGQNSTALDTPVVGLAATPDGKGYWLVAYDGGIFAFGAPFEGSMGGTPLNQPIVGMAATPDGKGYWLVASDGGIFAFGAPFEGSMGAPR